MTIDRMIELLEIEHKCMLRASHDDCDRNCYDCEIVQDDSELHEMYTNVIALLKESRWISVNERLPKSMANKVLVYLQHDDLVSQIGYGHYEKYKGQELWYNLETDEQFSKRGYTVTHWMPLPKSPNDEQLALS